MARPRRAGAGAGAGRGSGRGSGRSSGAALAAAAALLHGFLGAAAEAVPMPGHSLRMPPDIYALAENWFLAGTVIPSAQNMIVQPGVPGRVGLMWSPHPVLTSNFEVDLKLTIKAPAQRTVTAEGFAFWYVYENATAAMAKVTSDSMQSQEAIISNSWPLAMQTSGFDLLGYRSKFNGLGIFVTTDAEGKTAVSAVHNDGQKTITLSSGLPAEGAPRIDRAKELKLKIHVEPTQATVDIEGSVSVTVKADFKSGGYVGLTSSGGNKGSIDRTERCDVVELWDFKVANLDKGAEGEKMPVTSAAPAKTDKVEKEDVLALASSFKDHRAESDAIKELTNMVFKLIVETQPVRSQLTKAVEALGKRMTAMEETFSNLKKAIDAKTGHHLGEEFDAIKKELSALSTVASKETQERHKRLENLHEDIAEVHKSASGEDNIDHHLGKLTESNQRTLDSLTNEHKKMFGVSIAAIAFVIIAGLSLYNKFRCWEKKHVL